MLALDRPSRVALGGAALAAFPAAYVTTPIVARSQSGTLADHPPSRESAAPEPRAAIVAPRRDPFAGAPLADASAGPATPSEPATRMPSVPAAIGPLPPNAGAGSGPFPLAPPLRVTAIMTGAHPFALVDEGGTTRILTIGDEFGGAVIAAIRLNAVHLPSGPTLPPATPPSPPTPPPEGPLPPPP